MGDPNANLLPMPFFSDGKGIQAAYRRRDMMIRIADLIPYKENPFKPYDGDRLEELAESIREYGVLEPILVRPIAEGKYEILSGHNRVEACKRIEERAVPAVMADVDEDTAAIMVADANLKHRETLLPSEKARAYKMQLDALKRQAGRPSKGTRPLDAHLIGTRSDELLAEKTDDSARQIQRYIRLLSLGQELLRRVDEGEIPFRAAVELSHIDPKGQDEIARYLDRNPEARITLANAAGLRSGGEALYDRTISEIMSRQEKKDPPEEKADKADGKSRTGNPYSKIIKRLGGILSRVPPGAADPDRLELIIANAIEEYLETLEKEAALI